MSKSSKPGDKILGKRFRYKDGRKNPRKETDSERKERLFPGHDDMRKMAIGVIGESDPENDEECLVDDELSDDDYEDDDDCLIPMRWASLATDNPEIRKKMQATIKESRLLHESKKRNANKKKKKNCTPGNPYHDADGEFGKPGEYGSWSISNPDGKANCDHGQLRTTGRGNEKRWTKTRCGRKDPKDDNIKAKYKCKDGSFVTEGEAENFGFDEVLMKLQDRLQKVLDRDPHFLKQLSYLLKPMIDMELEQSPVPVSTQTSIVGEKKNRHSGLTRDQVRTLCARSGFFGWTDFLMKLNAIEAAKKGNIPKNRE